MTEEPKQPHDHYYPERREHSRRGRWVAIGLFCIVLSPLCSGCIFYAAPGQNYPPPEIDCGTNGRTKSCI